MTKIKLWQNSNCDKKNQTLKYDKTQIVKKLQNLNYDKSQKLKLWQNFNKKNLRQNLKFKKILSYKDKKKL